jgi:MYXO-CTERM domain-containing protein
MIVLLPLMVCIALVVLAALGLAWGWRRRRIPAELRGDWWARFESEFHDYAARAPNSASDSTRRARDKRSPPQ